MTVVLVVVILHLRVLLAEHEQPEDPPHPSGSTLTYLLAVVEYAFFPTFHVHSLSALPPNYFFSEFTTCLPRSISGLPRR